MRADTSKDAALHCGGGAMSLEKKAALIFQGINILKNF